jgi:hypothetical protein
MPGPRIVRAEGGRLPPALSLRRASLHATLEAAESSLSFRSGKASAGSWVGRAGVGVGGWSLGGRGWADGSRKGREMGERRQSACGSSCSSNRGVV